MNRLRSLTTALGVLIATLILSGCTAAVGEVAGIPDVQTSITRPASLAQLAEVQLTSPGSQHAGASPVFRWNTVDGAHLYRLTLITEDGPLWAWEGAETSVRLGGYTAEPVRGATALRLTEPGWWSVAALDDAGELLAISALFAVSPDERTPRTLAAPRADPEPGSTATGAEDVCSLLTEEEVSTHLGGSLLGPGDASEGGNGRYRACEWERADDEFATLRIGITTGASKTGWEESLDAIRETRPDFATGVPELGPDSYVTSGWNGLTVQVLDGDIQLSISSGMAEQYQQEAVDLAVLVLSRLAGSGS